MVPEIPEGVAWGAEQPRKIPTILPWTFGFVNKNRPHGCRRCSLTSSRILKGILDINKGSVQ
jgi:hypothetical protein